MDPVLTASGPMKCHCIRLHRGEDLLLSIRKLAEDRAIAAGVVLLLLAFLPDLIPADDASTLPPPNRHGKRSAARRRAQQQQQPPQA